MAECQKPIRPQLLNPSLYPHPCTQCGQSSQSPGQFTCPDCLEEKQIGGYHRLVIMVTPCYHCNGRSTLAGACDFCSDGIYRERVFRAHNDEGDKLKTMEELKRKIRTCYHHLEKQHLQEKRKVSLLVTFNKETTATALEQGL